MAQRNSTSSAWATGGLVFAAVMMIMVGLYQVFMGIAAIAKDEFFVTAPNYLYKLDTSAWGWIHLLIGILITLAGFFLFRGAIWARGVGIALAVLSGMANFFFVPYYPLWSLVIIAFDVFVIWALVKAPREI
ncbi:MAG TPA: hypothetical protein VFC00_27945 [Micromonosporaceae bacterium]|nr:hypothetical protein [Micromonosporaceae bacterium]